MKKIKWIFIALFVCVLASCKLTPDVTYNYQPPTTEEGQRCVAQCQQSKGLCQKSCFSNDPKCIKEVRNKAHYEYSQYVTQQQAQGLAVTRDLNSFIDPLQCGSAASCGCQHEYQACYEMCGGHLVPQN